MKPLFIFVGILIFSCSNNNNTSRSANTPADTPAKQTPVTLEDETTDVDTRSYYGDKDLIVRLYQEALKNDKKLNALEQEFRKIQFALPDTLKVLRNYDTKNKDYYKVAITYLANIKDTVLKARITQILANSNAAFEKRITPHRQLQKSIETRQTQLEDLHQALILTTTISMLETYQQNSLPPVKPLQQIDNHYQQLIKATDSVLKK